MAALHNGGYEKVILRNNLDASSLYHSDWDAFMFIVKCFITNFNHIDTPFVFSSTSFFRYGKNTPKLNHKFQKSFDMMGLSLQEFLENENS